jgi:hypothetical protein
MGSLVWPMSEEQIQKVTLDWASQQAIPLASERAQSRRQAWEAKRGLEIKYIDSRA